MKPSIYKQVKSFLSKWRIASTELLRNEAFSETPPKQNLHRALTCLRRAQLISSLSVAGVWYHFDYHLKRRFEALEKLSYKDRTKRFSSWGMDHHLKVIQVGLTLEKCFPDIHLNANLFSDHVSFSTGSQGQRGLKFVPDLTLTSNDSTPELSFIEVERTLKSKRRYEQRWLAYENDSSLVSCIYWVFDSYNATRLMELMSAYFQDGRARKKFRLAIVLDKDFQKSPSEKSVTVFNRYGRYKDSVQNVLFESPLKIFPSLFSELSSNAPNSNDINGSLGGSVLTPLPHPYHSTNSTDVAEANVRGVRTEPPSEQKKSMDEKKVQRTTREESQNSPTTLKKNIDSFLDTYLCPKIQLEHS
jgi:hypothetical protein